MSEKGPDVPSVGRYGKKGGIPDGRGCIAELAREM